VRRLPGSPDVAFPEDGAGMAVEFNVILGQYEGTVRIARPVFQHLLDRSPTPERCTEAFHLQRTRFELVVERKLRRRQLTNDDNIEITERSYPIGFVHGAWSGAVDHFTRCGSGGPRKRPIT
jgi:hypothetical protein